MSERSVLFAAVACLLAAAGPAIAAWSDYDGFDYTGNALHDQNGGNGWSGPWLDGDTDFVRLTDDGISLDSPAVAFSPRGSRISGSGAGEAARAMSQSVDLGQEGNVLFVSGLLRKLSIDASAADNLEINLTPVSTGTQVMRMGMSSDDMFFLNAGTNKTGAALAGEVYFLVGKIVSHDAAPDEFFLNVYGPDDQVPEVEPPTWLLTSAVESTAVLTHIRLTTGANVSGGEFDEIRAGDTWAGVTVPEPSALALAGLALLARRRRRHTG